MHKYLKLITYARFITINYTHTHTHMKKLILISALILPLMAAAQTPNFTITGKIGTLNKPAKVYIDYMDNGVGHEDSTDLVNGVFKFSGTISGNANARMALAPKGEGKNRAVYTGDAIYFYFGKEKIQITSKDSLSNALFTGSKVYNEQMAYHKAIGGSIMDLTKTVNAEFNSGSPEDQKDPEFKKAVDDRYRLNIKNRNEKMILFAEQHPNSFFGLVALSEAQSKKEDEARIASIYNKLNPALLTSDMGKELAQRIRSKSITAIGAEAPAFTLNDVNGKAVSLSDLKGKLVLVEFWASWCSPCRAENPNLVKQYKLYKEKGFEVIAVSLDSDKAKWADAIAKDGLPWIHVSDLKGWNNAVGRLYGVRGVPASFLVSTEGKILATDLRGESLNTKLAEIYK